MDVREKLAELIFKSLCRHIHKSCKLAENIADDLLADGVTVQECKVGDVVYCLYQECQKETKVIEFEIDTIEIHKDYTILQGFIGEHCYRYLTKEIGKAVF